MNKNKKLMSAGIWLYGLACVAGNQKTEMTTPVASSQIATPTQLPTIQPTQAPTVIIEEEDGVKYIETKDGLKKLHRVVDETPKPTKKAKKKEKAKATPKPTVKPTVKPTNKKASATKSPTKTVSNTRTNNTTTKLYNTIPLSASFQHWIDQKCQSYGLSTNVVMGVIKKESNFNITVMGDYGEAYGLMQVQKKWHMARMYKVGAKNLLNCYDNVAVGVDFLAELYKANGYNWHKTLMAYNGGQGYASSRCRKGLYSSDYSVKVMQYAEQFKKERND